MLILLSILFLMLGIFVYKEVSFKEALVFCDVGQGDATLLITREYQILIDAGDINGDVGSCLTRYMPLFDRKIELMIATHMDQDHVGGFGSVLRRYTFDTFLLPPDHKDTEVVTDLLSLLSQHVSDSASRISYCPSSVELNLDGYIRLNFWSWYEKAGYSCSSDITEENINILSDNFDAKNSYGIDDNDLSIVSFMAVGDRSVLLMGDLESRGELAMSNEILLRDVNVLKVAHHGSKSSSSTAFLSKVLPEISVISVGKKNRFGHPHPQVLANLSAIGSVIERTDLSGDVIFYLNREFGLQKQ